MEIFCIDLKTRANNATEWLLVQLDALLSVVQS